MKIVQPGKNYYPAIKTLELIESKLAEDQGNSFRQWLGKIMPHLDDAYRVNNSPFRGHLGASGLGEECGRKIWYDFRWFTNKKFDGRLIRLFNRGHMEEGRFIALLLMCGIQIFQQDANGKQFRISFANGHAGGSGDGIVLGVPEIPNAYLLSEFKTASDKKFNEFVKDGVKIANHTYYVQMQLYMKEMNLCAALFMVVNKDNDALHAEIVPFDEIVANQHISKGENLVYSTGESPPKKINNSPGFYKCKFCDHRPVCHLNAAPAVNCRTCTYSKPSDENNSWICTINLPLTIDEKQQLRACEDYEAVRVCD